MPVTVNLPNHAHSPRPLVSGNRPRTSENKRTERGTIMLKHSCENSGQMRHSANVSRSPTPVDERTRRAVGLRPTGVQELALEQKSKAHSCKTFAVETSLLLVEKASQHARAFTTSERFTTEPHQTRLERYSDEEYRRSGTSCQAVIDDRKMGIEVHKCSHLSVVSKTSRYTFRWILPLVVIAVVALCLILSPVVATHAAAPAIHHAAASHGMNPNWYWRP